MKMVAVIEKLKDLFPETGKPDGRGTGGRADGRNDGGIDGGGRYAGLWALYRKEMGDNIHSRRFLLILTLVVLAGFASLYGALSNISSAVSDGEFIFLKLFTTSGSSIPSFVSFIAILGPFVVPAQASDWDTEFGDYTLAVKVVDSFDEAVDFINTHGSGHSEAIVTEDYSSAQAFLDRVDAAAVYVNASTRFTDGFEFGLGAEIGISTQKMHARGPMGLTELTSSKYIIYGSGQVR